MKFRMRWLMIVSSTLLFASLSVPLTIQANQSTLMGSRSTQLPRPASRTMAYHSDGKTFEFDAPGATKVVSAACGSDCGTFAFGNNGAGTIVGYYTDKYVVPHGFIRQRDGRLISFDAPGAGLGRGLNEGTLPYVIDAAGVIVGQYEDANTIYHGFVREPNGSFRTFSVPGAGMKPGSYTVPWDLNGYGDTAGIYAGSNGVTHGFARARNGHITTFDPPGSVSTFVCPETCLSDAGIVGRYVDKNSVIHAFLREPNGTLRTFDAPGAGRGANQGTSFKSINANGTITGALLDARTVYRGFVRFPNGSYLLSEVPGAGNGKDQGSDPKSINAFDAIAGVSIDADNIFHAFERFANGALFRIDAPDAAGYTVASMNNVRGEVVGFYGDKSGLNHGFLWVP